MTRRLRLAVAQLDFVVGNIERNATKVVDAANKARDKHKAELIVFPELTLSGYPPEDLLLREGFLNHVDDALNQVMDSVKDIYVLIGHPWRQSNKLYNSASLIHNGKVLARYHKQMLPNYSVFDEQRYFAPGNEACVVELNQIKIGITICEDIWYAAPSAQCAAQGAQLILNMNASPFHLGKVVDRENAVLQRIRENHVPVVYVNLIGGQDELVFDGASFALDKNGDVRFRAPAFVEDISVLEVSVAGNDVAIITSDVFAPLAGAEEAAYRALVLGVRDYVMKNGFKGAVLGLSGGIDSALTLKIAVDALGAENVEAVMLPSRYTADMSLEDARQLATRLQVDYRILEIEDAFQTFLNLLTDEFAGYPVDVTEENIQARCRGLILMAISNKKGKIVLTTGNKSEMAVGYSTLYGDMAGGFDVLKDVPKNLVYRLSRYCNRDGEIIPARIIERPPSAELREDQTDQDSLPDYAILDDILEAYVEKDQSIESIVANGFDRETVEKVVRMVDLNEYKRRQAPPGVRITPKAFGKDRRMPIVNGYRGRYGVK